MRRKLLWIDGGAGATVGVVVLLAGNFLSEWYRLPLDLLRIIGVANLLYGCYSLTLASRARRPPSLIVLLVVANLAWAVACVRWAVLFAPTASPWGLLQLGGEAVFVGGLACLEWRWRRLLRTA